MCLHGVHVSRPDAQLFEGQQEEQQLNGELPDDILKRQIINSLAKHVIFSKKPATLRFIDVLHSLSSLSLSLCIDGHCWGSTYLSTSEFTLKNSDSMTIH